MGVTLCWGFWLVEILGMIGRLFLEWMVGLVFHVEL